MTTSANDIRRSFLDYFARQAHTVVRSAPLVPHEDPTLLFTNAGMNQFKDVFLGRETRRYTRATSSQKCMRVSGKHNDLGNVGPSLRHHTLFEMLGNFSFGDYFKQDAIHLAWTLLTDEWQLPADRLHATVFKGDAAVPRDDEAHAIWRTLLPSAQIGELGAADNFWQMGDVGPCGRCSEIYYYRGADLPCPDEAAGRPCRGLECDCDRYVEIWNNVFMEFDRQTNGTLSPLPAPSIDTGMGLERITAVLQGHLSNYDTDLFTPLLAAIGERAGVSHGGTMAPSDVSMRVIADHTRAMTFLIADGVVPSNEWRGYVLRKIMRRAMRHGKRLGIDEPFLHALVDTLVRDFGGAYPELTTERDAVARVILSEEERFDAVLASGLPRLEEVLDQAAAGGGVVSGDAAFRLYDTFGLPRDFIEDMVEERALAFDRDGFESAMEGQRTKARAKSKFGATTGGDEPAWHLRPGTTPTPDVFRGYDATRLEASVVELLDEHRQAVDQLPQGHTGLVALAETPFYLQAGGQISDTGCLIAPDGEAGVSDVVKGPAETPRFHVVQVTRGTLRHGDLVSARVDESVRDAARRHHTATHLLHAALRQVLGPHVKQAGSLVTPDRLRFDFAHVGAVTPEQLTEIERIVNARVVENLPVQTEVKDTEEAIAGGATALFGEKYGDSVRVVSIPGFSVELCGGTHVRSTGDIGSFAIASETGVSAGVRRIEAVTGLVAAERARVDSELLEALCSTAMTTQEPAVLARWRDAAGEPDAHADHTRQAVRAIDAILKLHADKKRLERENQQLRMKAAMGGATGGPADDVIEVAGVKVVAREVTGLDKDGLRALVDQQRSRLKSGVVILACPSDGKVTVVVGVTPDLTTRVSAGQVVKQIAPVVGGRGGGRPDFAEAGGKDPAKIGEMFAAARGAIETLLTAS
ncbi:MAG: alanine--tRNA ligase [Acidobacteria bacterium]|nr:alanine--tRNA ligase [Acidobacteriota bacterium]